MAKAGVAAQVLVGKKENLLDSRANAHLNAAGAFDDVHTTSAALAAKRLDRGRGVHVGDAA